MDKLQNAERAKTIFAAHSTKDTIYFSSDGQAFFDASAHANHVKGLKDKATHEVKRYDDEAVSEKVNAIVPAAIVSASPADLSGNADKKEATAKPE